MTGAQNCRLGENCRPLRSCPVLLKIIQHKPISQENRELLGDSHCGATEDKKPLVCCPGEWWQRAEKMKLTLRFGSIYGELIFQTIPGIPRVNRSNLKTALSACEYEYTRTFFAHREDFFWFFWAVLVVSCILSRHFKFQNCWFVKVNLCEVHTNLSWACSLLCFILLWFFLVTKLRFENVVHWSFRNRAMT